MVNKSLVVFVGETVRVGEDIRVTIDCGPLIDEAINNGISNPTVTWLINSYREAELSNGSISNVVVSADKRFCIITTFIGLYGNDGQYTCEVCNNTICMNKTSHVFVCGKDIFCLMVLIIIPAVPFRPSKFVPTSITTSSESIFNITNMWTRHYC